MTGQGRLSPRKAKLPRHLRPGWLKRMDQRLSQAKQLNERMAGIGNDLGGLDNLSAIENVLVEKLVHVNALASQIEERARAGQPFDVNQYLCVVDRVLRLGQVLGTQRRARPVPRALEYAAQVAAEAGEARSP